MQTTSYSIKVIRITGRALKQGQMYFGRVITDKCNVSQIAFTESQLRRLAVNGWDIFTHNDGFRNRNFYTN